MFDKKRYIASEVWVGNDYLIQPDTAAKRCRCCEKLFYAVEFPMVPEAVDGSMIICIKCLRSAAKAERVKEIFSTWDLEKTCRKCGQTLPVSFFQGYDGRRNTIKDTCSTCVPAKPGAQKEKDDEDDFDFENET